MKHFFLSTLLSVISLIGFGQTTLPTEWDFATTPATLPTGWSTNTTASYSSGLPDNSGGSSFAGKLQVTAHHFTIHFFDDPGLVTYNLRAYSSTGANFSGTFDVEESVNGSSWSTLASYGNDDFGNSWTEFTATADPSSRYIRFFFTDKISGINVGLDDVSIEASIPTEQEINVQYQGNDLPSGSEIQFASGVGNPLSLKFGVENIGTVDTLQISGVTLSGAAASDYSVVSFPSTVDPSSNDSIEVIFNPTATGSRVAVLSIASNDANENPYTIDLNGIGGNSASEPITGPSGLAVDLLKTYRVHASFNQSDAERYLVVFKKNTSISFTPQDGSSYEKGQGAGNAKVAVAGTIDDFWLKEVTADDTFYIHVYGFNGEGAFTNYLQSDYLDTMIITPLRSTTLGNYYSGVDETAATFVQDLHEVIFPHDVRFYSNYGPDMIAPFTERDTIDNKAVITGVYSADQVVYSPPFAWTPTNMSREHTLPYSWMPSNGSTSTPEYQDYHHLFPSVQNANSQRGNDPLGDVVNVTSSYGAGKRGTDAYGNTVYEPRDAQKGDAARALFYMTTTYHDPSGDEWGFLDLQSNGPDQRLDVLLDWHITDRPDGYEMSRNDYLDSLQENRNPFVDSLHWACYIDFRTMEYIAEPDSSCLLATLPSQEPIDTTDTTIGVMDVPVEDVYLFYPNPAHDRLFVSKRNTELFDFTLYDVYGRSILREDAFEGGLIDVSRLAPGFYVASLTQGQRKHAFRLVKE